MLVELMPTEFNREPIHVSALDIAVNILFSVIKVFVKQEDHVGHP